MEIKSVNVEYLYFDRSPPFDHIVIDDFISKELGEKLSQEFPKYESESWYAYNNPLEKKKTIREWGQFPSTTYQFFMYLCSPEFTQQLRVLTEVDDLVPDMGLHGAGWHISETGCHLNIHQDYSLHPLAGLQRKYNLILYLTPEWQAEWGGGLELWSHDESNDQPLKCEKVIENKFCRAVLFDTTQNSWHGFPEAITCPEGTYRKSIAMYYLTNPSRTARQHKRALYAPSESQKSDKSVIDLIKQRVLV